ncbi:DUF7289 family protein [Halopelagius longus]|uniref:Flagellin N-terminal-like domain-containing protein n=1 Tax=Halopelagius longus TaxID=1236180 RepID=A0A1H1DJ76_9EURY|nr:archaellin/type IV pilin N-terminal domain-containing protein [Halopelagius longus]RDI71335.1 flagellin-like protein [Halopelagius longus]SDQ75906.1 flagellin N-terminal-like domain-containing protein [Halopelagius longus]
MTDRAQSAVVGVALLLAMTVVGIGALTAAAGTALQDGVAASESARIADALDDSLDHTDGAGRDESTVEVAGGTLRVENRTVRVLNDSDTVWAADAGAVVYETGDGSRRVAYHAGAVTASHAGVGRMDAPPSVAPANGTLYVGVPVLNATGSDAVSAFGTSVDVTFRTNATHEAHTLPENRYRVAVETPTPAPWERHFAERNATTTRRDFDGDGTESVVAAFPGRRSVRLVVHDLRLEVA